MARGRIWQGIREWLRLLPRSSAPASRPAVGAQVPSVDGPAAPGPGAASEASVRTAPSSFAPGESLFEAPARQTLSRTGFRDDPQGAFDRSCERFEGGADAFEGEADAIREEELLEFLASDLDPVSADPAFRERLREELWEMVLDGHCGPPKSR